MPLVLERYALLHSCRVTNPAQAIEARLQSLGFNYVNKEDIVLFAKSLIKLDLSDNKLGQPDDVLPNGDSELVKLRCL